MGQNQIFGMYDRGRGKPMMKIRRSIDIQQQLGDKAIVDGFVQ